MSLRTHRTRLALTNLRHLWDRCDIRSRITRWIYTGAVRSILLCGSETWFVQEGMRKILMLEHCCLRSIDRTWLGVFVIKSEVGTSISGRRVLYFEQILNVNRFRWSGHVLHMPIERPPRCTLLFEVEAVGRGGQSIKSQKVWKLLLPDWLI